MSDESVPNPTSPERAPLPPYDPPEPAPQAAAWRRALKVVGCTLVIRRHRIVKSTLRTISRG